MKNEMSVMVAQANPDYVIKCFPKGHKVTPGDTRLTWDPSNVDEVDAARATFDKLVAKGFTAFRVEGESSKGAKLTSFDSTARKIIMIPKVAGGSCRDL